LEFWFAYCFLKALTNEVKNNLVFEKLCGVFKRIHQQVLRTKKLQTCRTLRGEKVEFQRIK